MKEKALHEHRKSCHQLLQQVEENQIFLYNISKHLRIHIFWDTHHKTHRLMLSTYFHDFPVWVLSCWDTSPSVRARAKTFQLNGILYQQNHPWIYNWYWDNPHQLWRVPSNRKTVHVYLHIWLLVNRYFVYLIPLVIYLLQNYIVPELLILLYIRSSLASIFICLDRMSLRLYFCLIVFLSFVGFAFQSYYHLLPR